MNEYQIQLRQDSAEHWTAANPVLLAGEFGVEVPAAGSPLPEDGLAKVPFKIGTGVTPWNSLGYGAGGSRGPAGKDVPTGSIVLSATDALQDGYVYANGEMYRKSDKPALFAAIGTTYGESADKTKFAVPRVAPVSVGAAGEVYVPVAVDVSVADIPNLNTVLYCDDGTGDPFLYLCNVNGAAKHIKLSLSDGTTQCAATAVSWNSTCGTHYCKFDGYIYWRDGTTEIRRSKPLEANFEKLPITLPAGFSSFCMDDTTGDIFILASPSASGKGIWRYTRTTEQLELLRNLDEIHKPTGGSASYRQMQYDPITKILYFYSYMLLQDPAPRYRFLTYEIETDTVNIGFPFTVPTTWPYVLKYIGGKMYFAMDATQDIQQLDKFGNLYMRKDVFPLRGMTSQSTIWDPVAYSPSGMAWWLSSASSSALRTYRLTMGTVAKELYHTIKE